MTVLFLLFQPKALKLLGMEVDYFVQSIMSLLCNCSKTIVYC